nr:serine/threonine-protein phosphatase 4 regulatory subunit 3-like [Ipomoea batatas]GME08082.1 serine/threonine-protein phosphatase 4 regulatory subunit 3-like [Ipomoea batatas]
MHHPYRIKCNFLLNNVIDKVLFLTQRREKYLVVSAVRFMRTLISRNDEHLMNHIVKNNLLKPIVDAFVANGNRYNLLNSAVLELFEYIRKPETLKVLLKYLVDTFWDQLVGFENFSSIQSLKIKYDQVHDTSGARTVANPVDTRKRVDERALEKEEEDYFNEDSDDEDSTSVSVSNANRVQSRDSRRIVANGSAPSYPAVRYVAFIQMYVYRHGLLIPSVIEGPGVLLIMMMMRMTRIINRHLRNSWILVMKME